MNLHEGSLKLEWWIVNRQSEIVKGHNENKLGTMELHEIFKKLCGDGDEPYDQKTLADMLQIDPATVGRIRRDAMPTWRSHYDSFWLIVDLCKKHGLDPRPARPLKAPSHLEGITDVVASEIEKFEQKEKMPFKKAPAVTLQKGGSPRHSRR